MGSIKEVEVNSREEGELTLPQHTSEKKEQQKLSLITNNQQLKNTDVTTSNTMVGCYANHKGEQRNCQGQIDTKTNTIGSELGSSNSVGANMESNLQMQELIAGWDKWKLRVTTTPTIPISEAMK